MRITTGSFKGRKISVPEGKDIRPTSDRARQAVFNILVHGKPAPIFNLPIPQGLKVLDLFCGSGALGLEALSRGAEYVYFIDRDIKCARENANAMGVNLGPQHDQPVKNNPAAAEGNRKQVVPATSSRRTNPSVNGDGPAATTGFGYPAATESPRSHQR